jgi:hypothetical protein
VRGRGVAVAMKDRELALWHLAEAERHIAAAAITVARQRELISTLERDGHDVTAARALLAEFEQIQAMHVIHRDRLLDELGGPPDAADPAKA